MSDKVKNFIEEKLKSTGREGIDKLIEYLDKSDFFIAPASTKYHGCYEGGLAEHSVNVMDSILKIDDMLNKEYGVPKENEESLILVSLLHDICKVNTYFPKTLWRKNEEGKWESYEGYERKPIFEMGHASKSVFIVQNYIKLTPKEAQAIYWHMGPYDLSAYSTANEMGEAYTKNTLAFKLNMADMLSTYILENDTIKWEEQVNS